MCWSEKIDSGANGEANFLTKLPLHLLGIKNVLTNGSQYILQLYQSCFFL